MIVRNLIVRVIGQATRVTPQELERQEAIAEVLTPETLQRGSAALDRAALAEARPPRPIGLRDGGPCPACPLPDYAGPTAGGHLVFADRPDGQRLECSASSFHTFPLTDQETP